MPAVEQVEENYAFPVKLWALDIACKVMYLRVHPVAYKRRRAVLARISQQLAHTLRNLLSAGHLTLLGSAPVMFWLSKRLLLAVEHSLALRGEGAIASVGASKLSKALRARGLEIHDTSVDRLDQETYSVVLMENVSKREDWQTSLNELRQGIVASARLMSVDRGAPAEVSRRFLCAGFTNVSQLEVGRQILTVGVAP